MRQESNRSRRVAAVILEELASLLLRELKDPRLHASLVTVQEVTVSRDLTHADIRISVLDEDCVPGVFAALDSAGGFIRSRIGKVLGLRVVPELHFRHDTSALHAFRMQELIAEANRGSGSGAPLTPGDDPAIPREPEDS